MGEAKHPLSPCSSCPFRLDVPLGMWDERHFHDMEMSDEQNFSAVFHCHRHEPLPQEKRGFCAGWLLNQKRLNMPNFNLRIICARDEDAGRAYAAVHSGGHKLFPSARAMCVENLRAIAIMKRRTACQPASSAPTSNPTSSATHARRKSSRRRTP